MEVEGVVQYRLLGSHPAASGRYHSFGFEGETVPLETVLHAIVRQHQINLTKYKLDVRRLVPVDPGRQEPQAVSSSTDNESLPPDALLRTYDRIVFNVSRRHYMDGATQNEEATEEGRLQHVAQLLQSEEKARDAEEPLPRGQKRRRGSNNEADEEDQYAFSRVAAVSNKAFPLIPWLRRNKTRKDTSLLPRPAKGTCVLCELESFEEVVLSCCHYSVCAKCLDMARVMLTNEEECAVCGAVLDRQNTLTNGHPSATRFVKQEDSSANAAGTAVHRRQRGTQDACRPEAKVAGVFNGAQERVCELAQTIEGDLKKNMAQILSLLDVADPLHAKLKEKRKISGTLLLFDEK